jgi:hypothetical protein
MDYRRANEHFETSMFMVSSQSSFQKSGTDQPPSESLCLHGNHLLVSGVRNFTLTYPSYTFRIFQV